MALSSFNVSPMTGSGSNFATIVEVSPKNYNTTHNDRQASLSVNAGGSAHPLTIRQFGIPEARRINGQGNIASGGGIATYVVSTHYDFFFQGIPDWITLSDKGGAIPTTGGTTAKIIEAMAANNEYYFSVKANPSATTRTTGNDVLNFRFYLRDGSTLDTEHYTTINITQDAGAPDAPVLNVDTPVYVYDWDAYTSGITLTANITSNVSWTATSSSNDFVIVGSSTGSNNGSIVVRPASDNAYPSASRKNGVITITNGEVSATITLTQYKEPFEQLNGSDSVAATGDTKYMTINSDYAFWYKAGSSLEGTNGYSTEYITMKYNGSAVSPAPLTEATALAAEPTGKTFDFVWLYNDAVPKNDCFIVQYRGQDGTIREMRRNFVRLHQDYIPQVEDYVYVSPSAMTIDWFETGNTNYFSVDTYSQTWSYEVQGDTNYFTFEKIGSILRVQPISQNDTNTKRNLTFTFSAGTSTATTTATASQIRKPSISDEGYNKTIPSSGGTRDLYVVSDYKWWIVDGWPSGYPTYSENVGSSSSPNSATTGTNITATFSANTTGSNVPAIGTAYFRVYYKDLSNTTRTNGGASTGWTQLAGTDELVATQSRSFADISSGGCNNQFIVSYYLTISSPTAPWGITITPAEANDWVRFEPSTGSATTGRSAQANLIVDANSGSSRSASISVSAGTAQPILFNLSQKAAYVPPEVGFVDIDPKQLNNVPSGGSYNNQFEVSANTAWTITSPEWVIWSLMPNAQSPITGGTGNKTIYAIVSENSGTTQRSGTAVFSSSTNSVNVSITQDAGAEPEPPTPVGNLEIDPAQISPASQSYHIYEVKVSNGTLHDYEIFYNGDWVQFYDGPDPSVSDEVNYVESESNVVLWLEVKAGSNRSTTIVFSNSDDPTDYITFYVNQP